MSSGNAPKWIKNSEIPIPDEWKDRVEKAKLAFGDFVERATTNDIKEKLSLSEYKARGVRYLIHNPYRLVSSRTVTEIEFGSDGVVRELPKIERWDRDSKNRITTSDLSWEEGEEKSVEDLIHQRTRVFKEKAEEHRRKKITRIDVNIDGPIAICHLGDPHVDDEGCNWPELLKTVEIISSTPGFYAGNIGDTTNNWVGRLERLYADQSTTFDEGVRLAEWLLTSLPWVYVILGNHDLWNKGEAIIRRILRDSKSAVCTPGAARIELVFPKGEKIRLFARHNFKGNSSWNRAHGPLKAAKMDGWGDIYIQGHKHVWASHQHEGNDGRPRWSLIVRGFKFFDHFADERGFYEHEHGCSVTTIIDPTAPPTERVRVVWDIEEAADLLKHLRKRAGYRD